MLADRNYWATYNHQWLILWEADIPSAAELGIDHVWEFARHILTTAEEEQVMRVIQTPEPRLFEAREGWTWLDYVRERFERKGDVVLFPGGGPTQRGGGRLRLPARLAYYKGESVVEEDVEDPGLLLQSLQHPEGINKYSTTPIWLEGSARPDEDCAPGRAPRDRLYVTLGLFTDIWFPRVIGANVGDGGGRLDEVHPSRGRDRLMDNSALAARHTPRLNRFVQTLRDAVLELGGTWSFDRKETDARYLPMLHDGGINLDYPAADA